MAGHYQHGRSARDYEDPAFAPRSSFDFEEEGTGFGANLSSFNGFSGGNMDFDLGMYDEEEDYDQQYFPNRTEYMGMPGAAVHGSHMSNKSSARVPQDANRSQENFGFGFHSSVPESRSALSNIVGSRSDSVSHNFGQITPPDDLASQPFDLPESKQSHTQKSRAQESGKLTNEQRARNAANTRHSRSKNAKKKGDQKEDVSDGEGGQKHGKDINVQREKNRVAAAKCRAKKKSANEQQEEMASNFGATNDYLTRQIRELKNQKTEFQNMLLAHRPGVCECHGVHEYNFRQAQRLVFNARRQVEDPMLSPSRESALSAPSPMSESSGSGMFPGFGSGAGGDRPGIQSRQQSFQGQSEYGFNQMSNTHAMQSGPGIAGHPQQSSHEFADFLQGSPGGRAGFN